MRRIIVLIILLHFSVIYAQGSEEFTSTVTGAKFVLVATGTFTMGSPTNESGRFGNETQHQVTISKPFFMQTTAVTQSQWKAVMGNNPSSFKDCGNDCPVEQVSWKDVQDFIQKLNHMEGTNKYRLPTEAEWEYAARAGTTTAFANGGITRTGCGYDPKLDQIGWYCGNSGTKTHPVARKMPNAWGLYDTHGNVYQWVQDWYGDYPSGSVTDPVGPSSDSYRVFRGGSWSVSAGSSRSANRSSYNPANRYSGLGFRLAKTP
jgi:formylglycine-generating enzyme required for sulfatase activity